MNARGALGRAGEELAAESLERLGYRILARNWRCSEGELDLVARRAGTVVFCEVKTRRSTAWGAPSEAVNWRKQARIRGLAARWMSEHRVRVARIRFDVVSIAVSDGGPEITHIPAAF